MADITKCLGINSQGSKCDLRSNCYLFTASNSRYQSFMYAPHIIKDGVATCSEYWADIPQKLPTIKT